jgi:molybdopterin molybdotransferase
MALMPVDQALARILDGAEPCGEHETLPLAQCFNRVLARDLKALRTHPPFAASAMDGYAVRAADAPAGACSQAPGRIGCGTWF